MKKSLETICELAIGLPVLAFVARVGCELILLAWNLAGKCFGH